MQNTREKHFKNLIYNDLVYFLMASLIGTRPHKKEVAGHILDTWATRNKKMVKESLDQQAKKFSKLIPETEVEHLSEDVAIILLSPQKYVFESIRKDLVESLKKDLNECFDKVDN